tara:strand:+ start:326 stop:610 length:285 start_codon:yes stop_codon:yes gene_type:complete
MSIYFVEENTFPGLRELPTEYPPKNELFPQIDTVEDKERMDMYLCDARRQFEIDYFSYQLDRCKGNVTKVAILSGMNRAALHRKLKTLGLKFSM